MNYDELHVVSDLHLGGEPDFQIFDYKNTLRYQHRPDYSLKTFGQSTDLTATDGE